jgi:hypothetical protein
MTRRHPDLETASFHPRSRVDCRLDRCCRTIARPTGDSRSERADAILRLSLAREPHRVLRSRGRCSRASAGMVPGVHLPVDHGHDHVTAMEVEATRDGSIGFEPKHHLIEAARSSDLRCRDSDAKDRHLGSLPSVARDRARVPHRMPVLGAPSTDEVTALHAGVRDPITWARSPSLSLVREERAQPEAVPSRRRARYH